MLKSTLKLNVSAQTEAILTRVVSETRSVHYAREELEADDGVNDHDKKDEEGNVQEGDHGHQDGVEHDLKACGGEEQGERTSITCVVVEARLVQQAREELEPNDCVDDYDKHDEQGNVQQGDHGHQDGVKHNLQAFGGSNSIQKRSRCN